MQKFRTREPKSNGRRLYRVSIKIDVPGKNAIQIRNILEGSIKSNGGAPIVNYKLVRRGDFIRLKKESSLKKYIQKSISKHYNSFMSKHGGSTDNTPVVLVYNEKTGSLILEFLISFASGIVLALLEPYLKDLSEYLKKQFTKLLSKKKDEKDKQEKSDKGQSTINVNIESLNISGNNIWIVFT